MADLGLPLEELSGQPLELFAREGAKMILSVALEEEVTPFWSADATSITRTTTVAIGMGIANVR